MSTRSALWHLGTDGTRRWAAGSVQDGPQRLLDEQVTLDALLAEGGPTVADASATGGGEAVPTDATVRAPIGSQEVWAAGVTYRRSREARELESELPDHYDRVYEADRPELFLKAPPGRCRGPGEPIGIRADSGWDVPEPELGLVVDAGGEVVAYVIGNDVSSRSIEGDNPLYLPQAKTYDGSCALGPCLVPVDEAPAPGDMRIGLAVEREDGTVLAEELSVSSMRRTGDELVSWLFRATTFPVGAILLTGTGIIPEPDFTLRTGDLVSITVTGLGELQNRVETVGS